MTSRRVLIAAAVGSSLVVLAVIVAIVVSVVVSSMYPLKLLENRVGRELPVDAAVAEIARSDGGFQGDGVSIYRVRTDAPTAGTLLDLQGSEEPVDGELAQHLEDLTRIAVERAALDGVRPKACGTLVAPTETDMYEAILCRTDEDATWLIYEAR